MYRIVRNAKRAVAVVLLGLLLGTLAAPAASAAADSNPPTWYWPSIPLDGVGDSPIVP
jgi:hypothetical protein